MDGFERSVSFRAVPDVWLGSHLTLRDSGAQLDENIIGVQHLKVSEDPAAKTVTLSYSILGDAGVQAFADRLGCLSDP